jgi:hypothetical protein
MTVLKSFISLSAIFSILSFQPALANDGLKRLCQIAQIANKSGASGKQEISATLQKQYGWSKSKADATTNLLVRENCPGVW